VPHEATLPDTHSESDARDARVDAPPSVLMLAVAFCSDERERAGEVATPPPGNPGPEVVWGRGGGDGDEERRLSFQRHRPGRVIARGEIASPKVSREQLRVRALSDRALAISNIGRAPLLHNGEERREIEAHAGDVIEIGRQVVLLCVRRPAWLLGPSMGDDLAFGAPDAHGIVGESVAAWDLRRSLAFLGPREGHVLVLGPSGSGKELVARALHAASPRAGRALVARNAATLPEGIIDAELFGNVKNYPNAGTPERPGIVGEADKSTLFLDEIAEIPAILQAHLLRLLDGGEYHRLGESRARRADVRVIAATNRHESALKHDLRARFILHVGVPGLEDRREDIPLIAHQLLRRIAEKDSDLRDRLFVERAGAWYPRFTPSLVRLMLRRSYPTNVRELTSLLWDALAASPGDRIEVPPSAVEPAPARAAEPAPPDADRSSGPPTDLSNRSREAAAEALSAATIQTCLDAHNGAIEETWRALGLPSRHALARLIKRHDIQIRRRTR
jgi:DNA-binding NtrC family response regulator